MATAAHFQLSSARTGQQATAASAQPQQNDLLPLFYSILGNVSVGTDERRLRPITIAEGLALNQEALLPLRS